MAIQHKKSFNTLPGLFCLGLYVVLWLNRDSKQEKTVGAELALNSPLYC